MKKKKSLNNIDPRKFDKKSVVIIYWVFQALLVVTFIASLILSFFSDSDEQLATHISHMFITLFAIVIFNIPNFIKKKFHLYIPSVLQIIALVFIWAHFILGDIVGVYEQSAIFDKILHTTSGIAIAAFGFSLVNILNESKNTHLNLSPFFVSFFAFCFSMMIAGIWEIFEYTVDCLFNNNMQRYIPPTSLVQEVAPIQGYGLIDTMGDLIVCAIGSLITSVLGYISLKTKSDILNSFMVRRIPNYDYAYEEAIEANDFKLAQVIEKEKLKSDLENNETNVVE